ncbi:MAG TPA: hypothetical protein VGV59_03255 [Pyrinomonadaceae bacterium]|nr:hypothetical protein [Pyrinomonadaceae bacterium]
MVDLLTGKIIGSNPLITTTSAPTDSDGDGWLEAVFTINVDKGCRCANIAVEYEGTPSGWTVNIGDSPTNNGFGGDSSGSPDSEAEAQVLDQALSVYNSFNPSIDPPGTVDRIFHQELALTNGAAKFVVCDQYLSYGQPHGVLQTPAIKRLFALPDPAVGNSLIFAGFNRVVSGPGSRIGQGARRVTMSLQ